MSGSDAAACSLNPGVGWLIKLRYLGTLAKTEETDEVGRCWRGADSLGGVRLPYLSVARVTSKYPTSNAEAEASG